MKRFIYIDIVFLIIINLQAMLGMFSNTSDIISDRFKANMVKIRYKNIRVHF